MNNLFSKIFKATVLASILVILTGCNYNSQTAGKAVAKEPTIRSTWLAYWDLEAGEKDLKRIENKLAGLSYFGAYFDENDRVFIPRELNDKRGELKKRPVKYETYLTFVNDKQNADGSAGLKDIEVLRRLFSDDAAMAKHIAEIIDLTLQGGYDGIEIDYERIWTDEQVGRGFLRFAGQLYAQARENNLKLRIVLEPGAPFSNPDFPSGPEYVVMFYNLYGLHSGPGPKANREFIQSTLTRLKTLPGEKTAAFATGGCLWGDNGDKRLLTEAEAKTLAVTHDAETRRDEESRCVVFGYQERGVSYQVWYADIITLNYWLSLAKEQGINNISLWRLGGNVDINKIN